MSKQEAGSADKTRGLAHFYNGKSILITGATGFVGKVCLVKLLSSLPDIGRLYVLLRPKKELSAAQRFQRLLTEDPFNSDAASSLDWSRVTPIAGDMSSEELGLSSDVRLELEENVEVVFNIAASVQFDAPLKQNLRDNYLGTRNLLQLATSFKRLVSLVHVSTFYSNSHRAHVEEKVVPMSRDCEKMAELISWVPDSLCDFIAPHIMENRPNTYIFTKAMTENLVSKFQSRLPVAIMRPSIVIPAAREPAPGWVDNVNGPMGLGMLAALGILRNIDWNYYGVGDFIPVDVVVNSMLAIAERTTRHPRELKVYNCSSSSLNPITWGEAFEVLREVSLEAPPYKMLRIPIQVPRHRRANRIGFAFTKLSEIFFAYFIDFILTLCGQKRILTRLTAKMHHGYEILKPFTTNEYTCSNDNLVAAYQELSPADRSRFNFDVRALDWREVFKNGYLGSRRRLLKEEITNLPQALLKMRVLGWLELTIKLLFVFFVGWTTLKFANSLVRPSTILIE